MIETTIDLPGVFDSDFSGSSVGQGQVERAGYDNAALLHAAYAAGTKIKRGKGYSLRLRLEGTQEQVVDCLFALYDYADTYAVVAGAGDGSAEDRASGAAARKVRDRAKNLARDLGWDVSGWTYSA